jgi:hypothetical protein
MKIYTSLTLCNIQETAMLYCTVLKSNIILFSKSQCDNDKKYLLNL